MAFGTHGAAQLRQLLNRKYTPNMRVGFDKESHRFYFKYKKGKQSKKLTAKEIAQLRHYLDEAKRNRIKYQILALFISLVLLGILIWCAFLFVDYARENY